MAVGRKAVGIDLNVSNFCTDSDGLVVGHPGNVKRASRVLAKQQQKLAHKKKGSSNRCRQKRRVALVHGWVGLRRNDFLHKLSRYYVDRYDLIAVEDLDINGLVQINGSSMRRLMLDAGWRKFIDFCGCKAEGAGRRRVKVDPHGTAQECSGCGRMVRKLLSVRVHCCGFWGMAIARGFNSALNIGHRGLKMAAWGTCEPSFPSYAGKSSTLAEIKTSTLAVNESKF
jgi:putative transposase